MSVSLCPAPLVITWFERTNGDDSTFRQIICSTRVEAELALICIVRDPANDDIRCSWLDPALLAELEVMPF